MKERYRLMRRGIRGGMFYCVDSNTGTRTSLRTTDQDVAEQIVNAKNQALRQPAFNLQIAKAYLAGTDLGINTRTWQNALDALMAAKHGANQARWQTVARDKALRPILDQVIIQTQAEALLNAVRNGTVSTNVYLRRLHNFCLDMNWLPWPLIPKRQWPAVRYKEKRAITLEEHQMIIAHEMNPERNAFYQLCWHLGASQGDIANLKGEDIDWNNSTIGFFSRKTGVPAVVHLGKEALNLLKDLPGEGPLSAYLATVRSGDRATEFKRRCDGLGIKGVTLHSYRYAWAERAKVCGYPERFAQEALGHNSKAVHRAYAKRARVRIPSLEDYEKQTANMKATVPVSTGG
jgi:integrase